MIIQERILRDGPGAAWRVETPTFRDSRLAALLEHRRERNCCNAPYAVGPSTTRRCR
ncbi:MAG: hypothetical protein HC828_05440 [Blastochloris sp.]|nr:hypothetical protein [Blastochloris sp.]